MTANYSAQISPGYVTIENGRSGQHAASTPNEVLTTVLQAGFKGNVVFRAGAYLFSSAVNVTGDDIHVHLEAGARLIPNHGGAIGTLNMTGDRAMISGPGKFEVPTWVNDQVVVQISTSFAPKVEGITVDFSATGGTNANPMIGLYLEDCEGEIVTRNIAHPVKGVIPFKSLRMDGGDWSHNTARVKLERTPTSGGTYAKCYVPFWIQGAQMSSICNNRAYGLGGSGADAIPYAILIQYDATRAGEQGHNVIGLNTMESCYAQRWIGVYGGNFNRIIGNLGGQNEQVGSVFDENKFAATSLQNQAGIHCDSSDGTNAGYGNHSLFILGNDIHNVGQDLPHIAVARSERVFIKDNVLGLTTYRNSIVIDGDTCTNDIVIDNNRFDGVTSEQVKPVYIHQPTPASQVNRIVVRNNTCDNFTAGNEPTYGVYGPYDPFGFGFDEDLTVTASTISFEQISTASGDYPKILDSGSGFGSLAVGDYIYVSGVGAGTNQNRGLQKIRTQAAGELELELELFDFGGVLGELAINDLADQAAGGSVTIQVYRRGLNSNVSQ